MDVVGITGVAVATVACVVAALARHDSQAANRLAQTALEKAEAANQLSGESNHIAREANRIAVDANELSQEANSITRSADIRAQERNHVFWDGCWEHPGLYRITNTGQDEAHRVRVALTCDGEQLSPVEVALVKAQDAVRVEVPAAARKYTEEQAEMRRFQRAQEDARRLAAENPYSLLAGPGAGLDPGLFHTHSVEALITWDTPLDQHRDGTIQQHLSRLDDFCR